jgi:hypothetical protein
MRSRVAGVAIGFLAIGFLAVSSVHAQYMISAHSGVIQYVEGSAYLNDNPVEPKIGQFPNIKENEIFRTTEGMAEVLLTPGVFLRMAENSSIRMVSNKLTDTRVEVLTGSALVECEDLAKDNAIMLLYKGSNLLLVKHGLYRVDAEQGLFKVYDGEAIAKGDSGQVTLHKGKETLLTGALMAENFDPKADDDLYRWSDRRSGYLAKANISSANSLSSGTGYGGLWNGWQFNQMFGMYTYVPYDGYLFSPFGYGFWSPGMVWQAPVYYGGGGAGGGVTRSPGLSHTGTGTGKHTPFIPSKATTASYRGGSSGGGYSGGGASRSSGFSTSSSSISSGTVSHAGGGTAHGGR